MADTPRGGIRRRPGGQDARPRRGDPVGEVPSQERRGPPTGQPTGANAAEWQGYLQGLPPPPGGLPGPVPQGGGQRGVGPRGGPYPPPPLVAGVGGIPPFGAYEDSGLGPEITGQVDSFILGAYQDDNDLSAGNVYIGSLLAAGYRAEDLGPTLFGRAFDAGFDMSGYAQDRGQVDPFVGSQTINQVMAMSGGEPVSVQEAGVDPLTAVTLDVNGDGWLDQSDAAIWDGAAQQVLGPGFDDGTGDAAVGGGMTQQDFQTQMAQFQTEASTRSEANFNRMMTIMMGLMGGRDEEEPYSLLYNPIGGA